MKIHHRVAALLVVIPLVGGVAFAKDTPAERAAKLAKLKAQRDAALKAGQAKPAPTPAATPAPTPTTAPTPAPVVTATPAATTPTPTPTTATTASAAASAKAAPSAATSAAKPPGSAAANSSAAPAVLPPKDRTDTAAIALDLEALKKSRADRRHAEIVDLKQRFGSTLLHNDRVLAELKQHAQRVAYLQRIRALSVKANDANLVKSVDELLTKEELRSANAVNELRSGALPAVAATPAAAAPGGAK